MNHEGAMARATVETHQLGFDWANLGSEASDGNSQRRPLDFAQGEATSDDNRGHHFPAGLQAPPEPS